MTKYATSARVRLLLASAGTAEEMLMTTPFLKMSKTVSE
jgi:hypothetical protein